ncbi:MAG: hypothetical protein N2645_19370 [Clostridia bacterium]|nr:hypothetical protein [Clostridia bacterium]
MLTKLDIKDIVLIGRTYDEYYKMFDLDDFNPHQEKILDAASGVSSFAAEASKLGFHVTASDRIYQFDADEIASKCKADLEIVLQKLPTAAHLYTWEFFKDMESLRRKREKAYQLFLEDYKTFGSKRYIDTNYPKTHFDENEFTLSLVSHFLFLYDEHLDYSFHKAVITELIRVTSKEIRIFPLINLKGEKSTFITELMEDKDFGNYSFEIRKVDYEFIKNGNEMLVINF